VGEMRRENGENVFCITSLPYYRNFQAITLRLSRFTKLKFYFFTSTDVIMYNLLISLKPKGAPSTHDIYKKNA
jgi:hypothetical protein